MTRTAISPRLAIKIFCSTADNVGAVDAPGSIWSAERWPAGWTVRYVAETGSTNTDLLSALEQGAVPDRTALVADHQTAGRGRLDRRWEAPAGSNLLVSLGFSSTPDQPARLTQRVGVAVVDALRRLDPLCAPSLKWPNDVLSSGAKLAGILAQRSASTGAVVVGFGVNIGWAPEGAARLTVQVSPAALLAAVLVAFDALAPNEPARDELAPDELERRYRAELSTLGSDVRVDLPGGVILRGRAADVDPDGRLVVEDAAGVTHHLDVGDVIHLR
jgi:BirA family biotin operon repressor/biotin-[acetyl-CoA-carboxylase] ligase